MSILNKKADLLAAFLLFAAVFLLGFIGLDNNCNWGDDYAAYMTDGFAMAQGRYDEQNRLNLILRSGKLLGTETEHIHAFGFPLLHALIYRLSGFDTQDFSNLYLYKLPSLIALSLMSGIYYLFLRRRLGQGLSFLISLALCADPEMYYAIRNLYNDVLFMAVSFSCFYFAELFLDKTDTKSRLVPGLVLGILLWYSYSVRLNGIVSILAVSLFFIIRLLQGKKKPDGSFLIPLITFLILFITFNRIIFPQPSSTSSASDVSVLNFLTGAVYYWEKLINWGVHFVGIIFDVPISLVVTGLYSVFESPEICQAIWQLEYFIQKHIYEFISAVFLITSLWGILRIGIKKDLHIVIFIAGSFIGTAALNLMQELRYLYVILPYLLMYAVLGAKDIVTGLSKTAKAPKKLPRLLKQSLFLALCFFSILPAAKSGHENLTNDVQENITAYSTHAIEVYNYIQDNTLPDETIAFFKPRALYLNTGRVAILPEEGGFSAYDADYYLHYIPMGQSYVQPEQITDFHKEFENGEFILYRRIN